MNEKAKIHAFYILLILFTIIIIQFSNNYATVPNFTEKFNFGLTIASLLLAILAIVYAYISDSSVTTSISKLEGATTNIVTAADEVKNAANDLSGKIEIIPPRLESIERSFTENFAALRDATKTTEVKPLNEEEKEAVNELAQPFVSRSSSAGHIAVYAAYKSFIETAYIGRSTVNEHEFEYTLGYLVAARAAGLMEFKFHKDTFYLKCTTLSQELVEYFSGQPKSTIVDKFVSSAREGENFRSYYIEAMAKVDDGLVQTPPEREQSSSQ